MSGAIETLKKNNVDKVCYMLKQDTNINDVAREDLAFTLGLKRSQIDDFIKEVLVALEKLGEITEFVNRDKVAQDKYFYIKMILEKEGVK